MTNWHKSSYSSDTANCVEVAHWRKSSYSSDTSNCVEIAFPGAVVGVRDSKNTDGPVLTFPAPSWQAFLPR